MESATADQIRETVRAASGAVASRGQQGGCCGGGTTSCCGPTETSSTRLGYTAADVAAVPDGADVGLGCGNPQAIAQLQPASVCSTSAAAVDSMRFSPRDRSGRLAE
jgi:hypothetical protein